MEEKHEIQNQPNELAIEDRIPYLLRHGLTDFDSYLEENKEFLSWFAGFWEGEGWLSTRGYSCQLGIKQKDKRPLEEILEFFKTGTLKSEKGSGKYRKNNIWVWTVSNKRDVAYISLLMTPFLRFRHAQIFEKRDKLVYNPRHVPWFKSDVKFLVENYKKLGAKEIARLLKKKPHTVRNKYCVVMKNVRSS